MLRSLIASLALAATTALAAQTPMPTDISFSQAGVTRTLHVPPKSYSGRTAPITVTETLSNGQRKFALGGQWVQFADTAGPVTSAWVYPVTQCPPAHPAETRTQMCDVGFTGSWPQTNTFTMGPPPGCVETSTGFVPTSPPSGACTPNQPPPPGGSLRIDFSFVDRASSQYAAFIAFANRTDEADPQTLAYAYKITGTASYCARAIPQVAAWMQNPGDFADDSYLQIDQYLAPAMMVRDWCPTVTSSQRADWLAKAKAAVDAVWAQGCPGWGVCDLQNNYHAHFVRATVYVAISSGEQSRITFALGKLNEQLAALNASQPGGGSLEGKGYQYAWKWLNDAALVARDSGFGDVFNANGYLSANTLEWVHATAPDMAHFAPIGSQPRDSAGSVYDYQAGSVREGCYLTNDAAVRAAAGYWIAKIPLGWYRANSWDNLWACPPVSTPPALVYNARGVAIYGRTAWDSSAKYLVTVAYDRSQSHAHSEFGEVMYWLNGGWGVVAGQSLSHSGINGEPPDWSTRAKSVVAFFNGSAAVRPVEGFPELSGFAANQINGDHSFCLDMAANYPGSGAWKRCIAFASGVATVTGTVRLTGATAAKQQWIVPGSARPACSGNACVAGSLKITVLAPSSPTFAIVPLSSFDSDFDRGGYRISVDCNAGCTTKLGPSQ